jgi:phage-related protein
MSVPDIRPLIWVGSSLKDLRAFPEAVKDEMGYALFEAQSGLKPLAAKPLKGFGGASVLEIVSDYQADTFRAVYTVKFGERVYVLHAFQKKSKKGTATTQADIETIKRRLKQAEGLHRAWRREQEAQEGHEES